MKLQGKYCSTFYHCNLCLIKSLCIYHVTAYIFVLLGNNVVFAIVYTFREHVEREVERLTPQRFVVILLRHA